MTNKIVISSVWCGKCGWLMDTTENDLYQCKNANCENCLKQWKIVQIIMERVDVPESMIPRVRADAV